MRNPWSGGCREYAPLAAAPGEWPLFYSEKACRNDCRCAVEGGKVECPMSLECICSVEDCPSTIEEAQQRLCSDRMKTGGDGYGTASNR